MHSEIDEINEFLNIDPSELSEMPVKRPQPHSRGTSRETGTIEPVTTETPAQGNTQPGIDTNVVIPGNEQHEQLASPLARPLASDPAVITKSEHDQPRELSEKMKQALGNCSPAASESTITVEQCNSWDQLYRVPVELRFDATCKLRQRDVQREYSDMAKKRDKLLAESEGNNEDKIIVDNVVFSDGQMRRVNSAVDSVIQSGLMTNVADKKRWFMNNIAKLMTKGDSRYGVRKTFDDAFRMTLNLTKSSNNIFTKN
jgi:hypothetical protein